MKLSIRWLTGIALMALFAVLAIGVLSTVEVVDSDQEVATVIGVADFSNDAPVVSIEQSIATDTLIDLTITAIHSDTDTTSDHITSTEFAQVRDSDSRLTVTTLAFSPDLSVFGGGGIL